jgi:hypothetical protein
VFRSIDNSDEVRATLADAEERKEQSMAQM